MKMMLGRFWSLAKVAGASMPIDVNAKRKMLANLSGGCGAAPQIGWLSDVRKRNRVLERWLVDCIVMAEEGQAGGGSSYQCCDSIHRFC